MSQDLLKKFLDSRYTIADPRRLHSAFEGLDPTGIGRSSVVVNHAVTPETRVKFEDAMGPILGPSSGAGTAFVRKGSNPGILAHELGHAKQAPLLLKLGLRSKALPHIGTLGAMVSDDKDTARKWMLGGMAAGLPTMAMELDASRRGASMIKGLGGSFKQRMGAYMGIPTYALGAATPWLAYKFKELFGGYNND